MKMKQTAIMLSASQYSFEDEKAKKKVEGCSIHYVLTENLAPCADGERPVKGYKPAKANLPVATYDTIGEVPGLYNLEFEFKPGADGKLVGTVVGLEFSGLLG